ncbi:MAG: type I restriction enzyme HsdR N-terminal domain-containing protein [Balneolaceae bacterium]|nr:type I restriction enzyme HsdR N-terminal domain-containing protein [Balneolaceae bacterium]
MPSVCSGQYPRRLRRDGEFLLWNPVTRTALRNRPEERVRLRLIDYLTSAGWPRTRISTEEGHRSFTEERLRTDIVCYGEDFKPALLVECKSGSVGLGERAARQAARYNEEVGARWLLLSNGREDHWYETGAGDETGAGQPSPRRLEGPPPLPELAGGNPPPRDFAWWRERGFLGGETPAELHDPLVRLLNAYWSPPGCPVRYLGLPGGPAPFPVDQYYLFRQAEDHRAALAPLPGPGGETVLAGVLNRDGENVALALWHPALTGKGGARLVRIYDRQGLRETEAGGRLRLQEPADDGEDDLPARWARELEELLEGG